MEDPDRGEENQEIKAKSITHCKYKGVIRVIVYQYALNPKQ